MVSPRVIQFSPKPINQLRFIPPLIGPPIFRPMNCACNEDGFARMAQRFAILARLCRQNFLIRCAVNNQCFRQPAHLTRQLAQIIHAADQHIRLRARRLFRCQQGRQRCACVFAEQRDAVRINAKCLGVTTNKCQCRASARLYVDGIVSHPGNRGGSNQLASRFAP